MWCELSPMQMEHVQIHLPVNAIYAPCPQPKGHPLSLAFQVPRQTTGASSPQSWCGSPHVSFSSWCCHFYSFFSVQMSCSPTIGSWFTSRELQHSDPPARPRKGLWSWHGQQELHMRRRSQWFQHQLLAAQFHLAWLVDPLKAPAVYGHSFGYLQNWGNLAKSNLSL